MENQSNILIVDDQSANLLALKSLLNSPSLNISSASSGNQALKMALHKKFDLVLLDVQMPQMTGYEVAQLLLSNKKNKDLPIIFITAHSADALTVKKGYESGAVDYITKPIHPDILKSKVSNLLELQKNKKRIKRELDKLENNHKALRDTNQKLQVMATTDQLTGLLNRHRGLEILDAELDKSERQNQPLSLIMMDVDDFKLINDQKGHQTGDHVLKEISRVLKETCRKYDVLIRWGGEEILIICPQTDSQQIKTISDRFLKSISQNPIKLSNDETIVVTASMGTASTDLFPSQSKESMIAHADTAMYRAKHSGKNCIRSAATFFPLMFNTQCPASNTSEHAISPTLPSQNSKKICF